MSTTEPPTDEPTTAKAQTTEPLTATERWASSVMAVVRLIPPGRVVSYGDLAAMFDLNPRLVGRILATQSEPDVPWWRVVNSAGEYPAALLGQALPHWFAEGILLASHGRGCRIRHHRADLADLADTAERLLGPLPGVS